MTELQEIQNYICHIIDSIAEVLGIEISIIDNELNIIAGTGRYKQQAGKKIGSKTISSHVIQENNLRIVDDPSYNEICNNCNNRIICPIKSIISYPITFKERVVGVINLIALTEKQKYSLLTNQRKLFKFIDRLSQLVALKITEINVNKELSIMADKFKTIIESLHEGIITFDQMEIINNVNRSACRLLNRKADTLIGVNINTLFNTINLEKLSNYQSFLNTDKSIEQELYYTQGNNNKHFICTITPIIKNNQFQGGIISFKNFKEIQKHTSHFLSAGYQVTFKDIIGNSDKITAVKKKAKLVANNDSTILIRGESGTGKELFARAIHFNSQRQKGPFIAINCGAIPDSLLESELFGYEGGAFTGARQRGKPGKFELADGGTFFLDEIGDLSLHLQVKLLRVIEERYIERIGGTKPIRVNVRIIAATNRNLEEMLSDGKFRDDLYYRLNVIPITIPSLRERKEDIPLLVETFIKKYNLLFNKKIKGVTNNTKNLLMTYNWPGNVRELENVIEYAMNLERGPYITLQSLPDNLKRINKNQHLSTLKNNHEKNNSLPTLNLKELESMAIREALKKYGESTNGKKKAAKVLGIGIATLYRRLNGLSN